MKKKLFLVTILLSMLAVAPASAECVQHDWTDWSVDEEPSCLEPGSQSRWCYECGATEEQAIPARGSHDWSEWSIEKDSSCFESGLQSRWCYDCKMTENQIIPARGAHDWSKWSIEDEPSCFEDGLQRRWCYDCYADEEQIIPAYGSHDWGAWSVDDPTCVDDGEKYRECKRCYEDESIVVPSTGKHKWSKWKTEIEPDCMNAGTAVRECSMCYSTQTKKLPKNPKKHSFGRWMVTKKATAFSKGIAERECYVCQTTQKKSVAKLKAAKASSKAEKQAVKVVTNFFSYAKKYDATKIKKCFASPSKVKLCVEKKNLAKFFRDYNKKYLKYAIKSINVKSKTATITVYCKYYDAYYAHTASIGEVIEYAYNNPKASTNKLDKYQYGRLVKWNKKYSKEYSYKTLKFSLVKKGNAWKISSYTKAIDNAIHTNYRDAYDTF